MTMLRELKTQVALPRGAVGTQLARFHDIFLCPFCSAFILAAPSASCPLLFLLISLCMCYPLYCCLQILGFLPVINSILHSLCFCFYAWDVSSDKPWAQRVFSHRSPDTSGPIKGTGFWCVLFPSPSFLGFPSLWSPVCSCTMSDLFICLY